MGGLSKSPLLLASLVSVVGFIASLMLWQADGREWLNVNVWVKPAKFFLSVALYLATLHSILGVSKDTPQRRSALLPL
jgi:hypothetical protein